MRDTLARIRGLAMVLYAWLNGLASGDQRRPTGSGFYFTFTKIFEVMSKDYFDEICKYCGIIHNSTLSLIGA